MKKHLPLLNFIAYLGLIIINFLAIQFPFFGKTPGMVSKLYPNLLTPADFSFSIWSVIYILLGVFIVYQGRSIFKKQATIPKEVNVIGYLFLLTCLCNIAWLLTWAAVEIAWAFAFIFAFWVLLILLYYRLMQSGKVNWKVLVPFGVYLGWICIAALANLNVLLIDLDFNFFGMTEEIWTASLIITGVLGTFLMLYLTQDGWFTLVIIWAYFGIYWKNQAIEAGGIVATTVLVAMIVLAFSGGVVKLKNR